jgi:hypothetical protein
MSCISIIDTRPFNFSIAAQTSRRGPKGHSGIVRPVSPLVPICPLNQIAHKYYYSSGHPCPFQIISNSHNVQFTRLFRTRHDHNLWYLVRTVLRVSPRYTMKVTFNVSPPLCIISLVMPVAVDARANGLPGLNELSPATTRSIEQRQEVSDFATNVGIASCLEVSRDEAFHQA